MCSAANAPCTRISTLGYDSMLSLQPDNILEKFRRNKIRNYSIRSLGERPPCQDQHRRRSRFQIAERRQRCTSTIFVRQAKHGSSPQSANPPANRPAACPTPAREDRVPAYKFPAWHRSAKVLARTKVVPSIAVRRVVCRRQNHLRRAAPIRQRFLRRRSRRKHRGDAGNNLARNLRPLQRFHLFTRPPKDQRIAALQADNTGSAARLFNHQLVNLLLRDPSAPATFSHTDDVRLISSAIEDRLRNQVIMQHNIRRRQQIRSLQRQQFWIARPCSHQIYSSLLRCRLRRFLLLCVLRERKLSCRACMRAAHRALRKRVQQRLALAPRRMRCQNFAPQSSNLIEPFPRYQAAVAHQFPAAVAAPAQGSLPPSKSQFAVCRAPQSTRNRNHNSADHRRSCTISRVAALRETHAGSLRVNPLP